ncbi:MAG: hypothetical protein EBY18_23680, partial [Alphaproteobacteria bacterium]|nr:hypothetical protein [Alphaproteobacteria bacterium]
MTIFSSDRRLIFGLDATKHRCRFAFSLVASLLVALAAIAVTTTPADAQVLTWDPNGASAGTGGNGTWNTSSLFWTGTSGTVAWPVAATSFDAYFGGTSGTVTMSSGISVNDVIFDSSYVVTGTNPLSFTGPSAGSTATLTVNTGATVDFQVVMPWSGSVTTWNKLGLGTLILTNNNSLSSSLPNTNANFQGTTILQSGTLGGQGRVQWVIGTTTVPGAIIQNGGLLYGQNLAGSNGMGLMVGSTQYGFYGLYGGRYLVDNTYSGAAGVASTGVMYTSGTTTVSFTTGIGSAMNVNGVAYARGGAASFYSGGNNTAPLAVGTTGQLTISGSANWSVTSAGDSLVVNGVMNLNSDGINSGRLNLGVPLTTSTTGEINFDGGTLRAVRNSTTFFEGVARSQINAGGATIDTQGFDVTVGQSLSAPSGSGLTSIALTGSGSGYIGAPQV